MRLRLFRSRPARAFAHHVLTKGRTMVPPPPPPTQPRVLIDVIGVGRTETAGGVNLTLLSVERYQEGHIALFRLLRARGRFERDYPSPSLELAVTPERTVPYRFWMMGGGGGGVRELEFRLSYAIVPAPPSDASETVFEVREISWKRYGAGTYKVVSVDTGPWRFRISG
jgi:hypothetical protein